MGVHGLWTLLEPVGRRIDIQAIANKRLAVGKQV
jgi:DNA excision repair protein ERCC-5